MFILRLLLILLISLSAATASASKGNNALNWKEKRNKNGIIISTSKVQGSKYKAVRGTMTIKGKLSSFVALVQDTASCSQWVDLCKKSSRFQNISNQEYLVYTYLDIPFPAKDRDVLAHVRWVQDPNSLKVSMTSKPTTGIMKKTKAVRIEQATTEWHFTPQSDGTVLIETFAHVNPNGPAPAWLTNMLLVKYPYKTMNSMRRIIESGGYRNHQIDFIQEPTDSNAQP